MRPKELVSYWKLLEIDSIYKIKNKSIYMMRNTVGIGIAPGLRCQFFQRMECRRDIIYFVYRCLSAMMEMAENICMI